MHFSGPSLHAPPAFTPSHKATLLDKVPAIAAERFFLAQQAVVAAPTGNSFEIPLTTVSLNVNFDAFIGIRFKGAPAGQTVGPLIVDSGNSSLIVPKYEDLAALPNFRTDYQVLADNVIEPWRCPAKIIRGPIEIPTQSDGVYTIQGCVFYACTGTNAAGERTANFGTGWISQWPKVGAITIQAPLTYNSDYRYAEFNYAPANTIFQAGAAPTIAQESSLALYKMLPSGYQIFEIMRD